MRSMGSNHLIHDVSTVGAIDKTIAEGIELLYINAKERAKKQQLAYDQQGILSIEYTQKDINDLGLQGHFPNGMANGVRIHFMDASAKQTLPVCNMVEGKIRSLCRAANKWTNDNVIVEREIIEQFKADFNLKDRSNLSKDEQKQLLEKYIAITLKVLYENKKARFKKMKLDKFESLVMKESTHYRTTKRDILVFDENENTFSYDHVVPGTTTAHDRMVGNPVANLGISFDGSFTPPTQQNQNPGKFTVTSSIMHHASLAPLLTKGQSELSILIDTCNHIEEIARQHAKLQRLGAKDERENSIDINWCYQLLTTNFGNADDQRKSYMRIAQAASIMDGSVFFEPSGNDFIATINLNMSLMNAGINPLHLFEYGLDFLDPLKVFDGEKGEQNRKAYLHLSSALRNISIPNSLDNNNDVKKLLDLLAPKSKLKEIDDNLKNELIDNTKKFNQLRRIYNAIQDSYALNEGRNITALLEKYNVADEDKLRIALNKLIGTNRSKKKLEYEMQDCIDKSNKLNIKLNEWIKDKEDELIKHREENKTKIDNTVNTLVNKLNQYNDENARLYICTLIFKARMDELYYSGEYYHPKNAVIFNAYTAAYQKLTGMSASTGCKSGNDRTYVMRLVLAAIQGRDISTIPLPPDYLNDKKSYDELRDNINIIAMSNSAIYTALNDTGGSPKASPNDYEILEPPAKMTDVVTLLEPQTNDIGLAKISDTAPFGKYAAHKLKPKHIKSQQIDGDVNIINQNVKANIQRNSKIQKMDTRTNETLEQHKRKDHVIKPTFTKLNSVKNQSVEAQAKEIWDLEIKPLLDENKKVALFYAANQRQANQLYASYNHLHPSLSSIFAGGSGQAPLFEALAKRIEEYNCRDQVHILPIPTSLNGGDNTKSGNQVSLRHIDKALENIAEHAGAGFTSLGLVTDNNTYAIGGGRSKGWWDTNTIQVIKEQDGQYRQALTKKSKPSANTSSMSQGKYTDQFLEDMTNKSVDEWDDKLKPAYDRGKRGIPSGKLSICKSTTTLQKDIYDQLNPIFSSINNPTINQIIQILGDHTHKELEDRWVKLANVCKNDLDSYFRLHSDKKLDLLFRAIAEFDANLRSWPSIETLEQLIIAQQKREACQALYKDMTRLAYKLNEATDSKAAAALQMKMDAYQSLINSILRSDKNELLSVMLREGSAVMKSSVTGPDIQLYPLANPNIQGALYYNRGYGWSQTSSKDLLDKLRDELVDMNTKMILHVNKPAPNNLSDTHPLLKALLDLQTDYKNNNRTTHLDDINKLIGEVQFIIDKYSTNSTIMNHAIAEKIRSAYEKEKRDYKKPTLGFFGTGKTEDDFRKMIKNKSSDHQYLKLLHKLADQHKLLVQDDRPSIDLKNLS